MTNTNPFDTPDTFDTVLKTLSHRHARVVYHYLRYHPVEVASVDDLVHYVPEHDEQATEEHSVEIHLHHATIPNLADAGVIEYDPRSETVRYREPGPVEAWLDHVVEEGAVPL